MKKIWEKYPKSRIVVFIDDLDRCSPKRALEVFESVKVFLDMEGFVFVMGLSHETIAKLIEAEYQASGIKGAEYIRKIIQIPFLLPAWNKADTKEILDNLLKRGHIDETYRQLIEENKDTISNVVEPIPREVKCFVNSFLISYKICSGMGSIKPKELLLIQALKSRWYDFYRIFSAEREFRHLIQKLLHFDFRLVSLNLVDPAQRDIYDITRSEIQKIINAAVQMNIRKSVLDYDPTKEMKSNYVLELEEKAKKP